MLLKKRSQKYEKKEIDHHTYNESQFRMAVTKSLPQSPGYNNKWHRPRHPNRRSKDRLIEELDCLDQLSSHQDSQSILLTLRWQLGQGTGHSPKEHIVSFL
jgi:hypothetical protein